MKNISHQMAIALKVADKAHRHQFDKGGAPYLLHPITVALTLALNGYDEQVVIAGLLHDVVEDANYTIEEIRSMGFSEEVCNALILLTHDKKVDYLDYVHAIAKNPIAKAVKTADLFHNMDESRLKSITDKDQLRLKKYKKALEMLQFSLNTANE